MNRRIACWVGALACLLQACVSTGVDAEARKEMSGSAALAAGRTAEYAAKSRTFLTIAERAVENARAAVVDAQHSLAELRETGDVKGLATAESASKSAARERTLAEESFRQIQAWANSLQLAADAAQQQARRLTSREGEDATNDAERRVMKSEKECAQLLAKIEKGSNRLKERWLTLPEPHSSPPSGPTPATNTVPAKPATDRK